MSNRWFITRDGKQRYGPFPDTQFRQLAASGKLLPSDMVWLEGSTHWIRANQVGGLFSEQPKRTELPEFHYAHVPLFSPDHHRLEFTIDLTGTLTGVSKSVKTVVSGGGGGRSAYTDSYGRVYGSAAPIWIRTTHETTMDLWILDAEGRESSVRIEEDIPLKEGHRVTVVNVCLDGHEVYRCMILNHTAGELHFLRGNLAAIRLSWLECLTILATVVSLFFVCALFCLFNVALGCCLGIITGTAVIVFVRIRGTLLRQRFRQHCDHVAGLLL